MGGFKTCLESHLISKEITVGDNMKETLDRLPPELKAQYEASVPKEMRNMVLQINRQVRYPLPNVTQQHLVKDITAIGLIWIQLILNNQLMRDLTDIRDIPDIPDILTHISQMPANSQIYLKQILIGNGVDDIIYIRSIYIYIYI